MQNLKNNDRLMMVAKALGELNEQVLYVGGSVVQLYSTGKTDVNPMTTYDVDCVIDTTSYQEYQDFERQLRKKRFVNDLSEDTIIGRFLYEGEKVDFIPKVDTEIGESNRWYSKGMKHRKTFHLEDGTSIYIMSVPYYLASKLEALNSRGGKDYRLSKDFEDIVFVLNTCEDIAEQLKDCQDEEVRDYLHGQFLAISQRPYIREEIGCSLEYRDQGQAETVLARMKSI